MMVADLFTDEYRQLKNILPLLLDEETGIIGLLEEMPRQTDMSDIFYYKATVANTGIIGGLQDDFPVTAGTSLMRDRAIAKAVGEAIERYCSALYSTSEMIWGTYGELKSPAIHPDQCILFSREQLKSQGFVIHPFTPTTPVWWTGSINLISGHPILIPACFIYCPYQIDKAQMEVQICENMSTGLAAHLTFEAATLNGIMEVIERDNFMLTWSFKISHPRIDLNSLNDSHLNLIKQFKRVGYTINILYAVFETGIPTIISVMRGNNKGNVPLIVSCATHLDPTLGVTKSLEELALMERFCKRAMITPSSIRSEKSGKEVIGLLDHIFYWLNPKHLHHADFLTLSDCKISLQDLLSRSKGYAHSDLNEVSAHLHTFGYEIYVADITTPDIDSLGMKVVRVFIPDLMPLNKSHRHVAFGSKRFTAFREKAKVKLNTTINSIPHPFA
jgi:ribosomal protein S12 methylthiotransferase accessory factor